jgi:hypothetical protein
MLRKQRIAVPFVERGRERVECGGRERLEFVGSHDVSSFDGLSEVPSRLEEPAARREDRSGAAPAEHAAVIAERDSRSMLVRNE